MTCCCLNASDEIYVAEVTQSVHLLADQSEDEVEATAKINKLEGVKITSICPNKTGSFSFSIQLTLPGEDRSKKITMTKRFK